MRTMIHGADGVSRVINGRSRGKLVPCNMFGLSVGRLYELDYRRLRYR
jgi:hypothetical protein